uniref:C2 domain-containing protein n=1 Tax=Setaria digitata TaxID=48799 RepID=A0A915PK72_9BILA
MVVKGFLDDHPDSYWLVADVLSIEWRKGCLTTAGCAEPRFQVTKVNTVNNEANLISWPVTLKLAEEQYYYAKNKQILNINGNGENNVHKETSRSFISHWTSRSFNDIALRCEVAGLDPTYGFPRICDSTPTKRIFGDESDHFASLRKQHAVTSGKLVVEVKGKCFNASLALQKYDRCPTCIEHRSIAVVEQYSDSETSSEFLSRFHGNDQFLYAVVILAAFAVILTAGFACLLIAFLHQKRRLNESNSKQLLRSEQLNTAHSLQICQDDSRYDIPWEQAPTTYRRSPYRNFKTKDGFTPISSSLMGPISDVMALARSDCRKTSPSSSFGTEPHDSGLESV